MLAQCCCSDMTSPMRRRGTFPAWSRATCCIVLGVLAGCSIPHHDQRAEFQAAQAADEITAYEGFLALYPDGELAVPARSRLHELRARAAWEQAKATDTLSAYAEFMRDNPGAEADIWEQARLRREQLDGTLASERQQRSSEERSRQPTPSSPAPEQNEKPRTVPSITAKTDTFVSYGEMTAKYGWTGSAGTVYITPLAEMTSGIDRQGRTVLCCHFRLRNLEIRGEAALSPRGVLLKKGTKIRRVIDP